MREKSKNEIRENVKKIDTTEIKFTSVLEYKTLARGNVWSDAIQAAMDEKKSVYIPDMGGEIVLDSAIIMDGGCNLKVEKNQKIRIDESVNTCMVRNRNVAAGNHQYTEQLSPDEYITVSGGVWTTSGNKRCSNDKHNTIIGSWGIFDFSNVNHLNISDVSFEDSTSYAIHIGNCHDFWVDNIYFSNYHKDGIHINGPTKYGIISNISGSDLGDDLIAMNAWDWYRAAITFGSIENVLVENVAGDNNEFRLLTGRKIYGNKTTHDCAIRNCVFENITGIYTFKLYYQPNCCNVNYKSKFDSAENVGEMENIFFKNVSFPKLRESGFNNIPIYGLFDILSDITNIEFEDISVAHSLSELDKRGIKLVSVGPISATYKINDNPSDWGDFFEPDMCCTCRDIRFKNISFDGKCETDKDNIIREVHQKINPDYPNTTPRGGTGFGRIENVTVE